MMPKNAVMLEPKAANESKSADDGKPACESKISSTRAGTSSRVASNDKLKPKTRSLNASSRTVKRSRLPSAVPFTMTASCREGRHWLKQKAEEGVVAPTRPGTIESH